MDKNKLKSLKHKKNRYKNKKNSKFKNKSKSYNCNNERLGLKDKNHTYHKPPDKLEAFPDAIRVKSKNCIQGGLKYRVAWEDQKYRYEWDSKHGTVEKYSKKTKKHLGEFDPLTGEFIKKPNSTYKLLN